MTELSQGEIDEVLKEGDSTDVENEELSQKTMNASEDDLSLPDGVCLYDFMRPNRFPKEQKRTIRLIHETYGQTLGVSLSAFLGTEVQVTLDRVEQETFQEYSSTLVSPTCICTFDMHPLGAGLLEINADLGYAMVDKMLGGDGNVPSIARAFTDLERAIMTQLSEIFLKDLASAWSYIINIGVNLTDIQTNPSLIRSFPMREICVVITLKACMEDVSSLVTICIPYVILEPITAKLGNDQWHNRYSLKQSSEIQEAHRKNFNKIDLELKAVLGELDLPMIDLLLLKKGDALSLNQKANEPIILRISGENKFKVIPGLKGRYKGICIKNEIIKD